MSTILEALKKSEQERKASDVPTLRNMPAPKEQSHWPQYLIIALLASLILILGWFALQGWSPIVKQADQSKSKAVVIDNSSVGVTVPDTPPVADEQPRPVVIDVVSYADVPEQRFVMIDGKLFREGEFVRPGLKIQTINVDTVVLNDRGKLIVNKP